jgi:hypothetical protein
MTVNFNIPRRASTQVTPPSQSVRRTSGREYGFALKLVGNLIRQEASAVAVLLTVLALMTLCGLGEVASSLWNLALPIVLKVMIASGVLLAVTGFIESVNTD